MGRPLSFLGTKAVRKEEVEDPWENEKESTSPSIIQGVLKS